MKNKINWFWAHRRNSSLHHFSFLMQGLGNNGWAPAVNFSFDNQIVIGIPGKGCYIFYDRNQLSNKDKFLDIQKSIDENTHFVRDFKRRTEEIFGAIFFKCMKIDEANLQILSQNELHKLYSEFLEAVMIAPIITLQLWGIEACFDDKWKIMEFVRKKLTEMGRTRDIQYFKEMLSVNTGETVAFTEQKDFYRAAAALDKPEILSIFMNTDIRNISAELKKFKIENEIFEKHIYMYEWVHKEYVSGGWSRENWLNLFKEALIANMKPALKLENLLKEFKILNDERQKVIDLLSPPSDVLHAINCLSEFIAQRDWAKGHFTKALLSYHKLLDEIANKMDVELLDLFSYSYLEIENYFVTGKKIAKDEINSRKHNGYAIVIKDGNFTLITGKNEVQRLINQEEISEPFDKVINTQSFKGIPASRGYVQGTARVIEDASRISELKKGDILVTYMTTIEFTPAFRIVSGVITDEGGMSSHAAIISREFGIPCVVGTKFATKIISDNSTIELNANNGVIKIIKS